MAWDTERTKQLLLDAATEEFSSFGLAGARIDRIAASAGVNKERIYQYFGKKSEFFGIVLERQLAAVMEVVQITGSGVEAITRYAGDVFDYQVEHPQLARLTFWEGLECDRPTAEEKRRAASDSKVVLVRAALPTISEADARDLLLTILTLADGWQVLHTLDRLYTGTLARNAARNASRRRAVVTAIESLARELAAQ
jgi:AcrR family transcriptional regulator